MSSSNEIIEARLASYIEGDLPPAERAEIEQYLAANPTHALMIEQLKQHKATLGALPREAAPVEVLDHLQSHLERGALLEGVEDQAERMKISRWPQWTAVAASLLLATGLGVLIYQVLPGGGFDREQITLAPPAVQQLPQVRLQDGQIREEFKDKLNDTKNDDAKNENASEREFASKQSLDERGRDVVETLADKMAASRDVTVGAALQRSSTQPARESNAVDLQTARLDSDPDAPRSPITAPSLLNASAIVVSTDDVLITQNVIAGYLARNAIAYESVALDQVEPLRAAVTANVGPPGDALPRDGAAYLLVRQITSTSAAELDSVITQQRTERQTAQLLRPIAQQVQLQKPDAQSPLATTAPSAMEPSALGQIASDSPAPSTQSAGEVVAGSNSLVAPDALPADASNADVRTDVLIVVHPVVNAPAHPTTEPATQPTPAPPSISTQPASTQPIFSPIAPFGQ